jgi:DNA-binding NtrC family response regulator/ligand-binding sensor domain-containing protein
MAMLARLSCWGLDGRPDRAEVVYRQQLEPVLRKYGLDDGTPCDRPEIPGLFSRVFALAGPADFVRLCKALREDPSWKTAGKIGRCRLDPFRVPCGPGRVVAVGPGFRQGLWLCHTAQDGLGVAGGKAILQDRKGYLWFAGSHAGGVVRYDGAEFAAIGPADGLIDPQVLALAEDGEGNLWFGTQEGACCFDGSWFTYYTAADGLGEGEVRALIVDQEGVLWLGGEGGASQWDGRQFARLPVEEEVRALAVDREGRVWLGTENGASNWDGERLVSYGPELGVIHWPVSALTSDREGRVWIGTATGVSCWDGERFIPYTVEDGLSNNQVCAIYQDREGYLWVSSLTSGISRFEGTRIGHYTRAPGFGLGLTLSVLADRRGNLWFGMCGQVVRCDGREFARFGREHGMTSGYVYAMLEDRAGRLWLGGHEGLCRCDGQEFAAVAGEEVGIWSPASMLEDQRGDLWLATGSLKRGAIRYDGREFTRFTTRDGLASDRVFCIAEDRQGALWFGTDRGVSRWDGERFATFTGADGLAGDEVTCMLRDRAGRLWLGGWGRLTRWDGERFAIFTAADGLVEGMISTIVEDRKGRLWLGIWGEGVCCFDGLVFQRLNRRDGLTNLSVQRLAEDQHGDIWIATEGGIPRYRPSSAPPAVRIEEVVADQARGPVAEIALPCTQEFIRFAFQGRSMTTPPDRMAYLYRLQGCETEWRQTRGRWAEYTNLPEGEYLFQVRAVDRDLNYSEPAAVKVTVEPDPHRQALSEALSAGRSRGDFVGNSRGMRRVLETLAEVAASDLTVLILGETGTGKGLAASALHRLSKRRDGPFVPVGCGMIPEGLVESELFGHEKGAFTGAVARKLGKVELAAGGTLFLDEIGDLPLGLQTRLLRLLEERTFERVGGTQVLPAEVRVVGATNRDLEGMVAAGEFRTDLYYRLNGFAVRLPPLRERQEDIPLLAVYFMERMASHLDKQVEGFAPAALSVLRGYGWPGNVRELEHVVQRAVVVCRKRHIGTEDLGLGGTGLASAEETSLEEAERRHIAAVLARTGWVVKGSEGAAALLGIPASTLRSRMKKLGITRP